VSSPRSHFGIVYPLESRPPLFETVFVGFQHTLAMFVGIITPPLIIAAGLRLTPEETSFFVSMALFASGISTVTQVMRVGPVGTGLLSVQGTSLTSLRRSSLLATSPRPRRCRVNRCRGQSICSACAAASSPTA
jgi:xanthine/uracil permease